MADEWTGQGTAHEGAEKNERYMEGNYDNSGNIVKRYKQKADDEYRSLQIAEEIKASQEAAYERETENLSYEYQAVGEAFTKLMKAYIEEDKYQQYLVDGAVLRCNQATTEDFDYNGGTVVLENKADEVCNIVLDVHENPISGRTASDNTMIINGHRYATVTDTLQGFNINPPKCNCRLAADRISEHEKIRADGDRNKNGVCTHLMWLNREWDNYRVEGTEYLKKDDAIMVFDTGEDGQAVQVDSVIEHSGVEGITMTSVLFCKHGGLIMPVTSGQEKRVEDNEVTDTLEEAAGGEGISKKALRTLMELEILDNYSNERGYLVIEDGKLIGIKPHLAGDKHVTVGFGDCLMEGDLDFYKVPERAGRISGPLSDKASEYDKIKDTVIPVDICFEKLIQDVTPLYEKAKTDFEKKGLILSQNQLDALCIIKYQSNTIGQDAYNAILAGSDRKTLYDAVLKQHGKNGNFEYRTNIEMNIFFGDGSDESYETGRGLSDIVVEPLEEYYEE